MGTWTRRINGWDLHGFDGAVTTTYAVYDERGRCRGTFDTYGDAVSLCTDRRGTVDS